MAHSVILCNRTARSGVITMSKVRNGIYKRGGSWYILYKVDGQQFRKSYGADRKAAEVALAEIKRHITVGRAFDDWNGLEELVTTKSRKTFGEAAQAYMDEKAQHKTSTVITYRDILDSHLLPRFKDIELAQNQ